MYEKRDVTAIKMDHSSAIASAVCRLMSILFSKFSVSAQELWRAICVVQVEQSFDFGVEPSNLLRDPQDHGLVLRIFINTSPSCSKAKRNS